MDAVYTRTPIIDDKIDASGLLSASATRQVNVFTTGAKEYAIVNFFFSSNGQTGVLSVGSTSINAIPSLAMAATIYGNNYVAATVINVTLHIGPNTAVYIGVSETSGAASYGFSGIKFENA